MIIVDMFDAAFVGNLPGGVNISIVRGGMIVGSKPTSLC